MPNSARTPKDDARVAATRVRLDRIISQTVQTMSLPGALGRSISGPLAAGACSCMHACLVPGGYFCQLLFHLYATRALLRGPKVGTTDQLPTRTLSHDPRGGDTRV